MSDVGLLNEKPLHASLKEWYAWPGDRFEVAVDGSVIDIVRDGLLLEIQTGSSKSFRKVRELYTNSAQIPIVGFMGVKHES